MQQVTIMVTEEVAEAIKTLVMKGHLRSARGRKGLARYAAFSIVGFSRPIKGDRWIRVDGHPGEGDGLWARVPKRYSYGG